MNSGTAAGAVKPKQRMAFEALDFDWLRAGDSFHRIFSMSPHLYCVSNQETSFRYFQQYVQQIAWPGEERCMVRVQIVD